MIRHTFSVFDGLGEKTEKELWKNGILLWRDLLNNNIKVPYLNRQRKTLLYESIHFYMKELEERSEKNFAQYIKRSEHWRFFEVFKNDAVCLDIETNGLSPTYGGYVTMVGLYNGSEYKCFVRGENLTEENLLMELAPYKYLITFYGAVFDVPFLMRNFPSLKFDILHFDICITSRRMGMRGGLKKFEKCLGIQREEEVDGLTGYDAVRLWEMYRRGNEEALTILIKYNKEDTVNLFSIGEHIYRELRRSTGIEDYLRNKSNIQPRSDMK